MLLFLAGLGTLSVILGIVLLNLPPPKRTQAPVRYAAIGGRRVVDTSSTGKLPHDWSGSIWPIGS